MGMDTVEAMAWTRDQLSLTAEIQLFRLNC